MADEPGTDGLSCHLSTRSEDLMRRLEMTLSAALIVSSLGFVGCGPVLAFGAALKATEKLSLPVKGETKLDVQSPAGSVTYIGDLDDKLEVIAEKRAETAAALEE